MREYKFRGKRRSDGEWLYGDLVHRGDSTYIFPPDGLDSAAQYEVDPETVGQYLSKDKNGVDMYERDIVEQHYEFADGYHWEYDPGPNGDHIGEAVLIASMGACMRNPWSYPEDADEPRKVTGYRRISAYRCEVIGNVHDTPSLLQGGEPDYPTDPDDSASDDDDPYPPECQGDCEACPLEISEECQDDGDEPIDIPSAPKEGGKHG